jgi:hypothetical protein
MMDHELIESMTDEIMGRANLHSLSEALRSTLGSGCTGRIFRCHQTIWVRTTWNSIPCRLMFTDHGWELVIRVRFDCDELEGQYVYSQLTVALDAHLPRWPDPTTFRGDWGGNRVRVELNGLCTPEDPLEMVVRHFRDPARALKPWA